VLNSAISTAILLVRYKATKHFAPKAVQSAFT
jgi:hypothetical protein